MVGASVYKGLRAKLLKQQTGKYWLGEGTFFQQTGDRPAFQ